VTSTSETQQDGKIQNPLLHYREKVLVLGASQCGKSTIFKQMLQLYGAKKFGNSIDRSSLIMVLEIQLVQWFSILLTYPEIFANTPHGNEYIGTISKSELRKVLAPYKVGNCIINIVHEYDCWKSIYHLDSEMEILSSETLICLDDAKMQSCEKVHLCKSKFKKLWNCPAIQNAYERQTDPGIAETMPYFMNKISNILDPNYIPTFEDFLKDCTRTSGLVEARIRDGDIEYLIFDLGGARSERRKWIHCISDTSYIIFVSAISAYNRTLYEDSSSNSLVEVSISY